MGDFKETIRFFARKFLIWAISLIVYHSLFFVGIMVFQSCQKDYGKVRIEKQLDVVAVDLEQVAIETMRNLQIIMADQKRSGNHKLKSTDICIDTESAIKSVLAPLVNQTRLLLNLYNVKNEDLEESLGTHNDAILAIIGLAILSNRHIHDSNRASAHGFFVNNLYANSGKEDDSPDWYDCLLRSVGISTVIELASGQIDKVAILKAVKKTARRTLGYFGVAIAIYEYGKCMEIY